VINKVVEYFKHLKEKILKKRRPSKQEQRELIFSAIPEGKRLKARKLYKALQKTESYQNLDQYFSSLQEFSSLVKEGVVSLKTNPKTKEAFQIIDYSSNSFTPAMSNFYGLFFNPLSIYAFIVKNQYAAARSIEVIREEIAHDGYQLRAEKAVTKKRMKDTLKLLKKLEFQRLRLDICSSLKIYGNAWLRVVKSEKTKTKTLQLLSPTRIMPVIDQVTEEIIGWDYVRGTKVTRYKVDELIHLWMFNAESYKKMGDPPLSSILIDI
jgi:CRISPR/Cas system-associated protein endoribonuclease Cas2